VEVAHASPDNATKNRGLGGRSASAAPEPREQRIVR
jgi:hypothetical protein